MASTLLSHTCLVRTLTEPFTGLPFKHPLGGNISECLMGDSKVAAWEKYESRLGSFKAIRGTADWNDDQQAFFAGWDAATGKGLLAGAARRGFSPGGYVPAPESPPKPTHDRVNHPEHYVSDPSGVECITITRHRNFNVGNAIKYLWRNGLKTSAGDPLAKQIEDLEKARWYIANEIDRLREANNE